MSTFKNSMKLTMSTPIVLRLILMGQKIMTGLGVDLLWITYLLNKGNQETRPFLLLKLQLLIKPLTLLLWVIMIIS